MSRFNCIQKIPVAKNSQLLNGTGALTLFRRVCRDNMVKKASVKIFLTKRQFTLINCYIVLLILLQPAQQAFPCGFGAKTALSLALVPCIFRAVKKSEKSEKNQAFPRCSSAFLCSKTSRKRLLLRLLLLINPFVISCFLTTAVKSETGIFTYEKPFFTVL